MIQDDTGASLLLAVNLFSNAANEQSVPRYQPNVSISMFVHTAHVILQLEGAKDINSLSRST